ncbi:putative retrotransposon hot spot (RHS) protein [Trypanosoma conorhini]|uniref:Putative retrotransposon hot spot (RHS) protein n=1 Tax=Trypanosoma conorhini TaxID=83891 RepID=A0A3R7N798_9TRYP|nr:putative retrotransposon hot spot (RHS) protein [Trypanosoma conorhini]RNE97773.1 putative retrotransposon hot spot (RHS) protein [Trypanosoma conorhini]
MPAKQKRAAAGKKEKRPDATDLPQGRRRAREGTGGDSEQQPAPQRRRVKETPQRGEEGRTRLPLPEGFYDSVFNAKWSHVLGHPGGEGEERELRMEVKEGQSPTQSWEYKSRGMSFELDDAVEQFSPPRPRLMVLSSEKGWPYSLQDGTALADCFVTAEAERVWKRLDGGLRMLFSHPMGRNYDVKRVLLLGTPGIGQSMTVGSYLLYQLLHYDAEQLQVAVYCLGGELAYVFDKTTQTATEHEGAGSIVDVINDLAGREKKGYIVYDVSEEGAPPSPGLSPAGWGVIVLGSPEKYNYRALAMQLRVGLTIMNCPSEHEVKAMCAWRTRDRPAQEQKEYWETVYRRMDEIGPVPRYILTEADFNERTAAVNSALQAIDASVARDFFIHEEGNMWCPENPFQKIGKVERKRSQYGLEIMNVKTLSPNLKFQVEHRLCMVLSYDELLSLSARVSSFSRRR